MECDGPQASPGHDMDTMNPVQGIAVEEEGTISRPDKHFYVRVYNRSPYPWENAWYAVYFFPEDSYKEKCPEADVLEYIHYKAKPEAFQRAEDVEPKFHAAKIRAPLNSMIRVDAEFLEQHPQRYVHFNTAKTLTTNDIVAQASSRISHFNAGVDFTAYDNSSDQTQSHAIKIVIKTEYQNVIYKQVRALFNKDFHPAADAGQATMPQKDKDFLRCQHDFLMRNLDPFRVSRKLLSCLILSDQDIEEIDAAGGDTKQSDVLLGILRRRGNVFDRFIEALHEIDRSHSDLAVYLINEYRRTAV